MCQEFGQISQTISCDVSRTQEFREVSVPRTFKEERKKMIQPSDLCALLSAYQSEGELFFPLRHSKESLLHTAGCGKLETILTQNLMNKRE